MIEKIGQVLTAVAFVALFAATVFIVGYAVNGMFHVLGISW